MSEQKRSEKSAKWKDEHFILSRNGWTKFAVGWSSDVSDHRDGARGRVVGEDGVHNHWQPKKNKL